MPELFSTKFSKCRIAGAIAYLSFYLASYSFAQPSPLHRTDSLNQLLMDAKTDSVRLPLLTELIIEYNDVDVEKALELEEQATSLASKLDSKIGLAQVKNAIGRVYWRKGNMELAERYHHEALDIFEQLNDSSNLALTIRYIGQDVLITRQYEKALALFEQAINIYRAKGNIKEQGLLYNLLSWIYSDRGDYQESLEMDYISLRLYEQIDFKKGIATVTSGIAEKMMLLGRYQEAYDNFKKTTETNIRYGDIINAGVDYNLMGNAARLMGRYPDALSAHKAALRIGNQTNNFTIIGNAYDGLGDVYHDQGNNDQALANYLRSKSQFARWHEYAELGRLYNKLAASYRRIKDYPASRYYLDSAFSIAESLDSKRLAVENYREAALLDSATGNWQGAYINHTRYMSYRDSIFSQQTIKEISALQTQYEYDKKEQAANAEREKQDLQRRLEMLFLSIISILICVVAALLFLSRRRHKKYNLELQSKSETLEEENREKNSILNVVSHDLKAPFNKIKGLTDLLEMDPTLQVDSAKELIGYIRTSVNQGDTLIRNLLDAQRAYDAAIKPEPEPVNLKSLITEFSTITNAQLARKNQRLEVEVDDKVSLTTDRNMLVRILDNLVSNASKFSGPGKHIFLKVWRDQMGLHLSVRDEGPGISPQDQKKMFRKFQRLSAVPTGGESSTGLGLSIVKALVHKLHGAISVMSELGQGASFVITFDQRQQALPQER